MSSEHVPVLLHQTSAALRLVPGAIVIDCTLGGGGHAQAILDATGPDGRLLGLDADPEAIARCRLRLARFGDRVVLRQASFRDLAAVAREAGFAAVQGVLLDLGVSAYQLASAERGFSFAASGPLDMRMDPDSPVTAEEIVNSWPMEEIANVIYRYGEEPRSRRIARAIVAARPMHTTLELAAVVSRALGGERGHRLHAATRVFQALRIAVNQELIALELVLPQTVTLLGPAGRLVVISFHSLEDRIVKQFMQREARDCICGPRPDLARRDQELPCHCDHRATLQVVTRRPIRPDADEIRDNPRSRSAKLRVAERLPS